MLLVNSSITLLVSNQDQIQRKNLVLNPKCYIQNDNKKEELIMNNFPNDFHDAVQKAAQPQPQGQPEPLKPFIDKALKPMPR